SPMSMTHRGVRLTPDQLGRRLSVMALAREVGRIRAAGTPVLTFQPTGKVLDVMGWNAMDASRRADVAREAHASATRRLERSDARERVALLD
ncbi:MAG TPA: hypothetical protein VEZ15_10715, partial [Acidimicrobiia bacterium]|nr:hypothetical protein [Acidimicrobiia bacterium]